MFVICIESSHDRGMGHLYRALNIFKYLEYVKEKAVIAINQNKVSQKVLDEKEIPYEVVDYDDVASNWERNLIRKYQVDVWLLDKFCTGKELAEHVKKEGVTLIAIDDSGVGASMVDLHFCSMLFHNLQGKYIYSGKEYLILNSEIRKYRRLRTEVKNIIVTLGGSDTHGVTVKAVKLLKRQGCHADIVVGPNFQHKKQLKMEVDSRFRVYDTVSSLIAKFYEYDLAITGGGVTCFEANASGLPCIIIANELHEIETAEYLAGFGGARFAGYYENITEESLGIRELNIQEMSAAALKALSLNGVENIYQKIQDYRSRKNAG